MNKCFKLSLVIYLFLFQIAFGQDMMRTLRHEGKLTLTKEFNSTILKIIPKGYRVKLISQPEEGIYFVDFKGTKGYLKEIYFGGSHSPLEYESTLPSVRYSESSLKEQWRINGMEKIEGIYESISSIYKDWEIPCKNVYGGINCYMVWRELETKYKLALIKQEGEYILTYLGGEPNGWEKVVGSCNCTSETRIGAPLKNEWQIGDVKARLYKTAIPNIYKSDYFVYHDKDILPEDAYITFENEGAFTLQFEDKKYLYIKLFPNSDEILSQNTYKVEKSSGTGYAISSNGYIVTNYHVTNGASSIKVRGINENFSKAFNAVVVIEDKQNDLSIIKIEDSSFTSLGIIPSLVANYSMDVGSSIFVLGYPLRATMGDEVKLTNGIVSSKTGFQGDATSYQITAPVQPGNSGGPLFDAKGNIIGIIKAKHLGAENVSYAIKSSYLLNLISAMQEPPKLQTSNILSGKSLSEQVKVLRKFTFIIEIN